MINKLYELRFKGWNKVEKYISSVELKKPFIFPLICFNVMIFLFLFAFIIELMNTINC